MRLKANLFTYPRVCTPGAPKSFSFQDIQTIHEFLAQSLEKPALSKLLITTEVITELSEILGSDRHLKSSF